MKKSSNNDNESRAIVKLSSQANPRALKTHIRLINKNLEEAEDLDRRLHIRYNEDRHELIVTSSSAKAIETFLLELPGELVERIPMASPANDNNRRFQRIEDDLKSDDQDVFRRFFIASILTANDSFEEFGRPSIPSDKVAVLEQELEKLDEEVQERKKPPRPKKIPKEK